MSGNSDMRNLTNFNFYGWDDELKDITMAEYIWIDGTGQQMRSKTKIYNKVIRELSELDWWTYDGSSTQQATTGNSEIYLKPVFFCKDPIRKKNSILVLCETYLSDKRTPARYNFRTLCNQIMEEAASEHPWFGMKQEFFLFQKNGASSEWPLGFPLGGYPAPQGRYYCSVGENNAFGRACIEATVRCQLACGLKIAGINSEVAPGQWEYQVGICEGIELGDHLWMSRYLLYRMGEEFGVTINLQPKPVSGDWNGSGCHLNFSTESTRNEGGLNEISNKMIPNLSRKHAEHIYLYGDDNDKRLTGKHETSSIMRFDYGEGSRSTSIRIPAMTTEKEKGYFEDRRPASNVDPYLSTAIMVDTCLLKSKYCKDLMKLYTDSTENNF